MKDETRGDDGKIKRGDGEINGDRDAENKGDKGGNSRDAGDRTSRE